MKRSRATIVLFFLAVLAALLWWWLSSPSQTSPKVASIPTTSKQVSASPPSSNANTNVSAAIPTKEEIKRRNERQIRSLFQTPIAVYGKVVDENGNPIPGAKVEIGINDKPMETGSKYTKTTDADGLFSLTGVRGIAFSAAASKEGYYSTDESTGNRNVVVPDTPQPTKDQPIVLVLRKMGETEPLIKNEPGGIRVAKDGTPTEIDLTTGRRAQNGQHIIRVEAWTENEGLNPNLNQPYNWRCRVSIPGGGLVERTKEFDFQAPETGYRPFDEVGFTKTDQSWKSRFDKDYFAQMPDGTYARFKFGFRSGGDHFFRLESYLNPKPGSRNLEFDPNKVVKSN